MRSAAAAAAILVVLGACYERGKSKIAADDAAPDRPAPVEPVVAQPGDPTGAPNLDAEVVVHLEAEPAHLNPLLGGDAIARRVAMGAIYEGLLCRGAVGEPPRPCLAERFEVDDSGAEWTFHLRSGVRWHDGESMTADDVLFTYRLLTGKSRAPSVLAAELDDLRALERVDERTVKMRFAGFRVGRADAFAAIPILPRHLFGDVAPARLAQAAPTRAPIGTGPLSLEAWTAGEHIALERFDGYWGQPSKARRVVHRLYASREQALAAVRAGELHVVAQVPVDEALAAAAEPGVRVFSYETSAYLAAVWNLRKPALSDARVRRALGMLLDRRGVVEQVFKGYARIVDGPFPPRDPVVPVAASFAAERRRASRLLAKVGGDAPRISLLVPSESRTAARIADIWAADAAPHAKLEVQSAPFSEVLSRARAGRFDGVLLSFTTGDDFDHYPRFHSSQVGVQNYGGLADDVLDAALEQVRAAPDGSRRRELEAAIGQRLDELQAYCFIASDQRVGLARAEVGGVSMTLDGIAAWSLWIAR